MCTLKKLNLDWGAVSSQRINNMNELDEFCLKAYEISALYKEKMNKYHDQKIEKRKFSPGDLVLLFNSGLLLFPDKHKSKWSRPFKVTQVFPHRVVELENKEGMRFKVNAKQIKIYLGKSKVVNKLIGKWGLD